MFWPIIIVLGIVALSVLIALIITGLFNPFGAFSIVGVLLPFAASMTYLRIMGSRRELKEANKKTFNYCFNKANERLREFPEGDFMDWNKGNGSRAKMRWFLDNKNVNHAFWAFYTRLQNSKKMILVHYDVENEDVVNHDYWQKFEYLEEDLFHGFVPFQNNIDYRKKKYNKDGSLKIKNNSYRRTEPSAETVEGVFSDVFGPGGEQR